MAAQEHPGEGRNLDRPDLRPANPAERAAPPGSRGTQSKGTGSAAAQSPPRPRIAFVTGRLAEFALRRVVERVGPQAGFDFDVIVLPISVAALMQVDWVARKLELAARADRVVLPGWCQGDVHVLEERFGLPFDRGPKDLHELAEYFGRPRPRPDLARHDIEILAEINHAPRLAESEIVAQAARLRADGADVIDLGCIPGGGWSRAGDVVRLLRADGFRVSIDSFDRTEVEAAVAAGAELVLSCNRANVDWAARLGTEVVAIPDDPRDPATLDATIERLESAGAAYRIDPVHAPIGHGFGRSLEGYFLARRRWPGARLMMGVANVTELVEVDSAGVNVVLAALCQELSIGSVLTTEVINWARSSVRELDIARRLLHYSFANNVLPKHVDSRLVMLRDPKLVEPDPEEIAELARRVSDPNFRIMVQGGAIHLFNRDGHWIDADPFRLFEKALKFGGSVDPSHAFYLGSELTKAATALALGKQYVQDEPLSWGHLTVAERGHRLRVPPLAPRVAPPDAPS